MQMKEKKFLDAAALSTTKYFRLTYIRNGYSMEAW